MTGDRIEEIKARKFPTRFTKIEDAMVMNAFCDEEDVDLAITGLLQQLAESQWKPIESAPRDGTQILLLSIPRHSHILPAIANGNLCSGRWVWPYVHREPSHWMPLPEPPK